MEDFLEIPNNNEICAFANCIRRTHTLDVTTAGVICVNRFKLKTLKCVGPFKLGVGKTENNNNNNTIISGISTSNIGASELSHFRIIDFVRSLSIGGF